MQEARGSARQAEAVQAEAVRGSASQAEAVLGKEVVRGRPRQCEADAERGSARQRQEAVRGSARQRQEAV